MSATYISMFVERRLEGARGKEDRVWSRMFPEHKQQVEWWSYKHIYIRGMGGGFHLTRLVELDNEDYIYFGKKSTSPMYRVAREDWQRLRDKWETQHHIDGGSSQWEK